LFRADLLNFFCKLPEGQRSLTNRIKYNMLRKTRFVASLLLIALAVVAQLAVAQEHPAGAQSATSIAKQVEPSRLLQSGVHPSAPLQTSQAAKLLGRRHALGSAPRRNVAAELASSRLPAESGKRYSAPAVSQSNFLASPSVKPAAFRSPDLHGINASRLRTGKHANLGNIQ